MEKNAVKWLFRLLIVCILSFTFEALTHVVNFGDWKDWVKLLFSAGIILCLFFLRYEHKLYGFAMALLGIELICSVFRLAFNTQWVMQLLYESFHNDTFQFMVNVNNIFNITLLICSFSAILLEYVAHSRVVKSADARLSKWWLGLAVATLGLSIIMNILSSVLMNMIQQGTLLYDQYLQIHPFLSLPGLLVRLFYLVCLFKTAQLFTQAENAETDIKDPTA